MASLFGDTDATRPLAVMRIGLAAVLLAQAFALAPHLFLFFGEHGIVQAPIANALAPLALPRITYLVQLLAPFGVGEGAALLVCFGLYVAALHLLLAGWNTRAAAIAAWLLHLSLKTTANTSAYGVFEFATIGLFYCTVLPVGAAMSMDADPRKREAVSFQSQLGLRVVQIHLCIVYLSSGIEKIRGEQWRNGEAIWRAVMRPGFAQFDLSWLAAYPMVAKLACWSTLAIELGYVFFVWPRRTRRIWASATIGMHAGIAAMMGLWSFSGLMIVLNAAAFLVPAKRAVPVTSEPLRELLLLPAE